MAEIPVVGQSPISFNVSGTHMMIPLTTLYFDEKGKLKADRWPSYAANASSVDALLARLLSEGVLRAGTRPAAKPAFTATAVTPGTTVAIEIETSNVVPDAGTPSNSKADFKVTESEIYTGVEVAKLKDVIGTASGDGKKPGLVFVSSGGAPELPKAGAYAMAGDPATVDIPKDTGGGNAFSLKSRGGSADAALTLIEIKDVDSANNKFTLAAKWSKSAAGLAMTGLAAAFAYSIAVTAPASGFLAPVAGKTTLSGGSDAVAMDAVASSGTVLAQ